MQDNLSLMLRSLSSMSQEKAHENLEFALNLRSAIAFFGLIVTTMMIALMIKMKTYRNRLMSLVFWMNTFQLGYDLSLLRWCGPSNYETPDYIECRAVLYGLLHFSAMCMGTCTNFISCLVAYVIMTNNSFQLSQYLIITLMIIPSIVVGIVVARGFKYHHSHHDDPVATSEGRNDLTLFDTIQSVSAGINFIAVAIIISRLHKIGQLSSCNPCSFLCQSSRSSESTSLSEKTRCAKGESSSKSHRRSLSGGIVKVSRRNSIAQVGRPGNTTPSRSAKGSDKSKTPMPMFLLAQRLIWYPVVATLTLFASMWYHLTQRSGLDGYAETVINNSDPDLQTVQLYILATVVPLTGIAYASVFLFVQPGAWVSLKMSWLYVFYYIRYCSNIPPELLITLEVNASTKSGSEMDHHAGSSKQPRLVSKKSVKKLSVHGESNIGGNSEKSASADGSHLSAGAGSNQIDKKLMAVLDGAYVPSGANSLYANNYGLELTDVGRQSYSYDAEAKADAFDYAYGEEDNDEDVEEEWDFDQVDDLEDYICGHEDDNGNGNSTSSRPASSSGLIIDNPLQTGAEGHPDRKSSAHHVSPYRASSSPNSNL